MLDRRQNSESCGSPDIAIVICNAYPSANSNRNVDRGLTSSNENVNERRVVGVRLVRRSLDRLRDAFLQLRRGLGGSKEWKEGEREPQEDWRDSHRSVCAAGGREHLKRRRATLRIWTLYSALDASSTGHMLPCG